MPWHLVFEALAYAVAFRLYVSSRKRAGDFLASDLRASVLAAAIIGAALGSKVLFWFESPSLTLHHWHNFRYLLGGKTIVGALLGGTFAVELLKRHLGIHRRTGDLFAIPLATGIAIGRLGCLFAGLSDDTYGLPTSLPWAINLGDGVPRHPVQLYEVAAMLLLIPLLARIRPPLFQEGDRYRVFLFAYCLWRVFVDFFKPVYRWHGLGVLQWICLFAALWYSPDILRILRRVFPVKIAVHG